MNEWERGICSRFKLVRESLRWPQPEFAQRLGITRDQLSAIELGSTPLRYDIAWKFRQEFGISLRWLEEGFGFIGDFALDYLPPPGETGLPERALLSAVVRKISPQVGAAILSGISTALQVGKPHQPESEQIDAVMAAMRGTEKETGEADARHRIIMEDFLVCMAGDWVSRAPVGKAGELSDKLAHAANAFLSSFPPESAKAIDARSEQMEWERLRTENARKLFAQLNKKQPLTQTAQKRSNSPAMNSVPTLTQLLAEVRLQVKARGKKAELAKLLGVSQTSVAEWLQGKKEPSGNIALRLLKWVRE